VANHRGAPSRLSSEIRSVFHCSQAMIEGYERQGPLGRLDALGIGKTLFGPDERGNEPILGRVLDRTLHTVSPGIDVNQMQARSLHRAADAKEHALVDHVCVVDERDIAPQILSCALLGCHTAFRDHLSPTALRKRAQRPPNGAAADSKSGLEILFGRQKRAGKYLPAGSLPAKHPRSTGIRVPRSRQPRASCHRHYMRRCDTVYGRCIQKWLVSPGVVGG